MLHICSTRAQGYHEYIDDNLPPESPYLYGLHPNAEIGFLTVTSERLFRTVLEMQPKESDAGGGSGASREEKVSEDVAALVGVAGRRDRAEQGTQHHSWSCRGDAGTTAGSTKGTQPCQVGSVGARLHWGPMPRLLTPLGTGTVSEHQQELHPLQPLRKQSPEPRRTQQWPWCPMGPFPPPLVPPQSQSRQALLTQH